MKQVLAILMFVQCMLLPLYATDSEVISYTSHIRISGNKIIWSDSVVIQINNPKGSNTSYVSIDYLKNEKANIEDARIEDIRGNIIRKLKKNEIKEESAISGGTMYQDRLIKYAYLKHNQYPYRIAYSSQKSTSDFLAIASWTPLLFHNQDVKQARLIVDIPSENYNIKYRCKNIGGPVISTSGERTVYQWNTSYTSQKAQKCAPDSELKIPTVDFLPLHFKYEIDGSWESWVSFGDFIHKLNAKTTILPDTEKQTVDLLLAGVTDPEKKAVILYKYLQEHTRYINVSIKTGGLKSYPAGYVSQNKYGDCKALSTYMIALLEYAGIKAYYTLISLGDEVEPVDRNFPFQVFNHVIVTLPLNQDTIFLECTSKNIPMGYVGTSIQGRDALMIIPGKSFLIQTPSLQPEDVKCTSSIQIFTNPSYCINNLKMQLRGRLFEAMNYFNHNLHEKEVEKALRNYVLPGNFDFQSFDLLKEKPEKPEITLQAKIQTQNCFKIYGKNIVLSPLFNTLPSFEPPAERTQGVRFEYPIVSCDTLTYSLKQIELLEEKPENNSIDSPFGKYSVQYDLSGNDFRIIKNLLIFKGFYPVEEYKEFYKFWTAVQAEDNKKIYLETK